MCMYASSGMKRKSFYGKVNSRCFRWFPVAIFGVSKKHRPWKPSLCFLDIQFVYQNCTQIWRLHTKLYNGAWNVSANNSETVGDIDLRIGQIVYIYISLLWNFVFLASSTGWFQFIFCAVFIGWQWKWCNNYCLLFLLSLAYVPHCDLMQFIAMASSGAYLANAPPVSKKFPHMTQHI